MTAPIRITPEYELYRVITDYEALQDGFLDRIEDLNTTFEQIEVAGEIPRGHASRLLMKSDKRVVKALGPRSLQQMLKGTGLVLALIVDDVRFAPLKEQMVARKRPRKPPNGSSTRPTWLFTRKMSLKMQALRTSKLSEKRRQRIARKAGKASGKARRRKAKVHGALLAQVVQPLLGDGKDAAPRECQMVLGQAEAEAQIVAPHADAAGGAATA